MESELSLAPEQEVGSSRGARQDGDHFNHATLCRITYLFSCLGGPARFPQDRRGAEESTWLFHNHREATSRTPDASFTEGEKNMGEIQ